MSETIKETEDYLHEAIFGGGPKSVGEAVELEESPVIETPPREDGPEVVPDEPPSRQEPGAPPTPAPSELPVEPDRIEEEEGEDEAGRDDPARDEEDEGVVWAKRKYGDDPVKWARAAHDQERHITQLAREKREADELANQWYEYAQEVERQAQTQMGAAMPLSAQEEAWVEQSLVNPIEYARSAALNGKVQLYNGVIERVAQENPGLAAQIGTQVQMELASMAQEEPQAQAMPLEQALAESFNRLGLNMQTQGPKMVDKLGELGQYHPYVRAIMEGNESERDLAIQAVSDLVRATSFTPRQAQQQANIAKENELRRDASSVQTGGLAPPQPPPASSPLLAGMEAEWRKRGQWHDDE